MAYGCDDRNYGQLLFPDADALKSMKMALIHDLVEVYAGDVFAFDEYSNDPGNAFWEKLGWERRQDLNYYNLSLNRDNH